MKRLAIIACVVSATFFSWCWQDSLAIDPERAGKCQLCFAPQAEAQSVVVWNKDGLNHYSLTKSDAGKLHGQLTASAMSALITKIQNVNQFTPTDRHHIARDAVMFADEALVAMGVWAREEIKPAELQFTHELPSDK